MSFTSLIDQLTHQPTVKGRQFEGLCRWYLENAPEYRTRLKRVWPWREWPGRWGPDAGIDLVAQTVDGDLWAVQAKAEEKISKREIDSFLSESNRPEFAFRLLIATTDGLSANAYRTIVGQEKPVGLALRSHLEAADVEWPHDLEALGPTTRSAVERRDHQREAISEILAGFHANDRGQLIMACGTGKTLVAVWVAEDLACERTLVLVPSLTLLSQTLREWTANASKPFGYLAVCSDETVAERDAMVSHTADLGLPVTTDPTVIRRFLKQMGRRVIFATYQSSPRIAEAFARVAPPFDLAVADEAHRCTGPTTSDFTTVLDADQISARHRLFMTATPRRFTGRIRKAAKEADLEIASMDDEEKFGPVFHKLTFGEAIERDLLSDYIVFVVGVDEDTYRQYLEQGELITTDGHRITDARTLASHIGLAKAVAKQDLRRVISFHGRVKKAQSFSSAFPDVVAWMPAAERPDGALWASYISGEMPTSKRNVLLGQLRDIGPGSRALLSNARCLAEGVDVPAIDGVTFIDPKGSTIDIIQAVGRAIRKSPEKRKGVVVLPVFVTDDEDPETVLQDSSFKAVWQVLSALRAHDEALAEELDGLRRKIGKDRGITISRPIKIVVDLPVRLGPEFTRAFDVRLVERSTASWEFWFGLLERYVGRTGTAAVPGPHVENGFKLGKWVLGQHAAYKEGNLSPDQIRRLSGLSGWDWGFYRREQFEAGVARLIEFRDRKGHCDLSQKHLENGFPLGVWLSNQRTRQRTGKLEPERQRLLEDIGVEWNARDSRWKKFYARLVKHVERAGHPSMSRDFVDDDGSKLGLWLHWQRAKYRKGEMPAWRQRLLESIPNWHWSPRDALWEEGLIHYRDHVERTGRSDVLPRYTDDDDFKLGTWLVKQRTLYKRGKLDLDQRRRLEEVGIDWGPWDTRWQENLNRYAEYVKRAGRADVPSDYGGDDGYKLGRWLVKQRLLHKQDKLSLNRRRRLEEVGIDWSVQDSQWEKGCKRYRDYVERTGISDVPHNYADDDGFKLGAWLVTERQLYKRGKLDLDQRRRLEEVGIDWSPRDTRWQENLNRYVEYVERTRRANVPRSYVDDDGFAIGVWLSNQRHLARRGELPDDRKRKLEAAVTAVGDQTPLLAEPQDASPSPGAQSRRRAIETQPRARRGSSRQL